MARDVVSELQPMIEISSGQVSAEGNVETVFQRPVGPGELSNRNIVQVLCANLRRSFNVGCH